MTNILCYGDSNTWGCIPLPGLEQARRFAPDARWPGVLRREASNDSAAAQQALDDASTAGASARIRAQQLGVTACGGYASS